MMGEVATIARSSSRVTGTQRQNGPSAHLKKRRPAVAACAATGSNVTGPGRQEKIRSLTMGRGNRSTLGLQTHANRPGLVSSM